MTLVTRESRGLTVLYSDQTDSSLVRRGVSVFKMTGWRRRLRESYYKGNRRKEPWEQEKRVSDRKKSFQVSVRKGTNTQNREKRKRPTGRAWWWWKHLETGWRWRSTSENTGAVLQSAKENAGNKASEEAEYYKQCWSRRQSWDQEATGFRYKKAWRTEKWSSGEWEWVGAESQPTPSFLRHSSVAARLW